MKINPRIVLFLIILLYIFLAISSMYPYYVGDEVLDITCAKAIIQKGIPVTPYGAEMLINHLKSDYLKVMKIYLRKIF